MAGDLLPKNRIGHNYTHAEALELDASDTLSHLRSEFIIPSKDDLKRRTLSKGGSYTTDLR